MLNTFFANAWLVLGFFAKVFIDFTSFARYHDVPDVLDFLVLRQAYDASINQNWRPGMLSQFNCKRWRLSSNLSSTVWRDHLLAA